MIKRGLYLSEVNAARYIKDAGVAPAFVLESVKPFEVRGNNSLFIYSVLDIQQVLHSLGVKKFPDLGDYLTRFQKLRRAGVSF